MPLRALCVFCGASSGNRPEYAAAAEALGRTLAERGIELVFGGGGIGMMGTLARAALAAGGKVTGVIPEALQKRELALPGMSELHVVGSMHERKALMAERSDGFVALPGGFGTLEEFFEVLTWAQLGFHAKPVALLDVEGFYAPLIAALAHMEREGYIRPAQMDLILADSDIGRLLGRMDGYRAPPAPRWIQKGET
jgi:hypothetical protein